MATSAWQSCRGRWQEKAQSSRLYRLLSLWVGRNIADARISFELTQTGVIIWDYDTGTRYTVDGTVPSVTKGKFEVPKRMKEIFAATNEQLKKRWDESWLDGRTDERETIFTELVMRGVNMLPGQ